MFSFMKRWAIELALVVAIVVTLGVFGHQTRNEIQNAPIGRCASASAIKTFSGSINTEATILTGTSGKKVHIVSIDVNSSGAGIVVFKDGTGGTTVLNAYCAANTPRQLTDLFGSNGLALTQNVLTATLSGATLTCTIRYWEE